MFAVFIDRRGGTCGPAHKTTAGVAAYEERPAIKSQEEKEQKEKEEKAREGRHEKARRDRARRVSRKLRGSPQ